MTTWNDAATAAPDLARDVRERFTATGLGFLATLRADGAPRISGIEPSFWSGELWLGMMDGSRKAHDLQRDPRFSLHAASIDKNVADGDARISGRAVEVVDDEVKRSVGEAFAAETDFDPNEHGPFHLFRAEVTELFFLRPAGDHLDLRWWTPGGGLQQLDRH